MEGFANSRVVNNYQILSKYYDELLQDEESFSLWSKYFDLKPYHSVLELASGSALFTNYIKNLGKDIIASDISLDMKEVAKNNFDGEYLLLDMRDFNLDKKFDLIICVVDSINYLEDNELDLCFISVYKHLNDGGRFIFDMHHINRLNEFEEEYIEEGYLNDIAYQWCIQSEKELNQINQRFTFYIDDMMYQEYHSQNVFSEELIMTKMKSCGYNVYTINDFVEDEKVLVIGEKKSNEKDI